jgi:hypothetical protein
MVAGNEVRVAAAMGVGVAGWGVAVGADATGLGEDVRPQARDNRSKQKNQSQNRRIMYLVVMGAGWGM